MAGSTEALTMTMNVHTNMMPLRHARSFVNVRTVACHVCHHGPASLRVFSETAAGCVELLQCTHRDRVHRGRLQASAGGLSPAAAARQARMPGHGGCWVDVKLVSILVDVRL
jgi:hypothetical protein